MPRTRTPEPDDPPEPLAVPSGTRPPAVRIQRAATVTSTASGRAVVRVRWREHGRTREARYPHRGPDAAAAVPGDALTYAALRAAFPALEAIEAAHTPTGAPEQRWLVTLPDAGKRGTS